MKAYNAMHLLSQITVTAVLMTDKTLHLRQSLVKNLVNSIWAWFSYNVMCKCLIQVCHGIVLFINTQASQMNLLCVLRIWEHILTSKVCSIYNHFLLSVLFHAKMIATSDEWEWLTAVFSSWWQVFVNGWQLICLCVYILRHPRCWITSCDGGGGSVCL